MAPPKIPLRKRLWSRVDTTGICWEWRGYVAPDGYGRLKLGTRNPAVHRVVWEFLVGPILEGMTLDHLCRVRHCVNPDHIEVVSLEENIRRAHVRSHCKRGHPLVGPRGERKEKCRPCAAERQARHRARRKAAA